MTDMDSKLVAVNAITPQTVTSGGGAVASSDVDLQGFDGALISFAIGANGGDTLSGSNYFTLKLEHAADDGTGSAGSYSNVDSTEIVGATAASGVVVTVDDAAEDDAIYQLAYIGGERFIKVTITPTGTLTNGNPASVAVIKGAPSFRPAS